MAGAVSAVALGGLWFAVHRVQWLGPAIADGLRSVLGPGPVAWMEDVAYDLQDRVNRWRYADEAPKTFWEAPATTDGEGPALVAPPAGSASTAAGRATFVPAPFEPPDADVATPADGKWVAIPDPAHPSHATTLYKSVVHPDPKRGFAALAVVAIDTGALDVELMAGMREPTSHRVPRKDRPGMVPSDHHDGLIAAFNGGFKTTHGHYGMTLNGVEFVPPRDTGCTFVRYQDGRYAVRTWSAIADGAASMRYHRQTPPCLVERGALHESLTYQEYAKGWGATVSGNTVIRRSAIGISEDGTTLFYGIGESMTVQAMAVGMKAAGAHDVAELDVNHSYPRFLLYERPDPDKPPIATTSLIPHVEFTKWHYVGQGSPRDFFYLHHRSSDATSGRSSVDGRPADMPPGKLADSR
jgi:Phosphodiester glycosidase